jgi:Skp family chaperone for outer membrane proteins
MKAYLKGLGLAALAAGVAAPALAQDILSIDLDRVYTESAAGKAAQAQLQARYQAPSQQAQTAFNTARSAYETQLQAAQKLAGPTGDASKLTPAVRQSLGQAQERLEAAREQAVQVQQAVQASAGYVRDQITQKVLPLAEQIRAEKKATAVVPRGSLLAADPAGDITTLLLPRLDATLTTVPIVPPQAAAPTAAVPAATAPAAPVKGKSANPGR